LEFFWIFFIFLDFPKFYPRRTDYKFVRDNMYSPAHKPNALAVLFFILGAQPNASAVSITAGM
jgi:hypothetical protein